MQALAGALCAQPLMPTARIAAMMTMRFFIGWFWFVLGCAAPPFPPMQPAECLPDAHSKQGEKVVFQMTNAGCRMTSGCDALIAGRLQRRGASESMYRKSLFNAEARRGSERPAEEKSEIPLRNSLFSSAPLRQKIACHD